MGRKVNREKRETFLDIVSSILESEKRLPSSRNVLGHYEEKGVESPSRYGKDYLGVLIRTIRRAAWSYGGGIEKAINAMRPEEENEGTGGVERRGGGVEGR